MLNRRSYLITIRKDYWYFINVCSKRWLHITDIITPEKPPISNNNRIHVIPRQCLIPRIRNPCEKPGVCKLVALAYDYMHKSSAFLSLISQYRTDFTHSEERFPREAYIIFTTHVFIYFVQPKFFQGSRILFLIWWHPPNPFMHAQNIKKSINHLNM